MILTRPVAAYCFEYGAHGCADHAVLSVGPDTPFWLILLLAFCLTLFITAIQQLEHLVYADVADNDASSKHDDERDAAVVAGFGVAIASLAVAQFVPDRPTVVARNRAGDSPGLRRPRWSDDSFSLVFPGET